MQHQVPLAWPPPALASNSPNPPTHITAASSSSLLLSSRSSAEKASARYPSLLCPGHSLELLVAGPLIVLCLPRSCKSIFLVSLYKRTRGPVLCPPSSLMFCGSVMARHAWRPHARSASADKSCRSFHVPAAGASVCPELWRLWHPCAAATSAAFQAAAAPAAKSPAAASPEGLRHRPAGGEERCRRAFRGCCE